VISTLLTQKRVDKVGNGKAYEMLSCLNGALEYYRTVGSPEILQACLNAWQDIVANRLYITGAASYHELFHDNYDLPNVSNVGETCVTVTWLQFNAQLLRLTGEARFADQLEHVVLNQLFGAQRCDGSAWGYYVQMEGKKPYSSTLDGHCCLSSGPRGVALIPTFAWSTDESGVVVNLYNAGSGGLTLRNHMQVNLNSETTFPASDQVRIDIDPASKSAFTVKLRLPTWCAAPRISVNGKAVDIQRQGDGYQHIHRTWNKGDRIDLSLQMEPRVIVGNHKNDGRIALCYGPLVLSADQELLNEPSPNTPVVPLRAVAFRSSSLEALDLKPEPAPDPVKSWSGARVFRVNAVTRTPVESLPAGSPISVRLIPFADAGGTGSDYKIWLPLRNSNTTANVLLDGHETRSRPGNLNGSIIDDDLHSTVVTFDGKPAESDWFGVALDQPVTISRIVFAHGATFHDGGWFDTTQGKPGIEVLPDPNGHWQRVGELETYPAATATDSAGLRPGQTFTCSFKTAIKACAVRVIGKPACGDDSKQAFSSCGELQAFSR
jgi:hypothetical protein